MDPSGSYHDILLREQNLVVIYGQLRVLTEQEYLAKDYNPLLLYGAVKSVNYNRVRALPTRLPVQTSVFNSFEMWLIY